MNCRQQDSTQLALLGSLAIAEVIPAGLRKGLRQFSCLMTPGNPASVGSSRVGAVPWQTASTPTLNCGLLLTSCRLFKVAQ